MGLILLEAGVGLLEVGESHQDTLETAQLYPQALNFLTR